MAELLGERLILREWRVDEVQAMYRWQGNPEVTRYLSWGAKTLADSAEHLASCIAEQGRPDREAYFLAVQRRDSGEVVGDAGFRWTQRADSEGRFGYFLEPATWGQGYGTEAARLVLKMAFVELGASVVRASCDERNHASERVMQKCGMRREHRRESTGMRAYRIFSDEWESDAIE